MIQKPKPYFIAEIGINHNGDVEIAKQLIDVAKIAGADAVKFQTFKAEKIVKINTKVPSETSPFRKPTSGKYTNKKVPAPKIKR